MIATCLKLGNVRNISRNEHVLCSTVSHNSWDRSLLRMPGLKVRNRGTDIYIYIIIIIIIKYIIILLLYYYILFKRLRATAGVGPSCGYAGLCWPMLAYLAGNVGPAWGYVGPAWAMLAYLQGYVGRSWGLCWPMLTHVEPKDPKNGNSKKTL